MRELVTGTAPWCTRSRGGGEIQTFLPYADFAATAEVLDRARLGKQRVEVLQILRALRIEDYGWRTHPAVTMWTGHVEALVAYGEACNAEWAGRGHADTTRLQILEFAPSVRSQRELAEARLLPAWLGWEPLHRSHRSALVRKDPEHYRPLFPDVPDDLAYVWPDPPPAAPPDSRPFSAWVVRATTPELLGSFLTHGVVALPADGEPPKRRSKRHRIAHRFLTGVAPGHLVVVPIGLDQLLLGQVESEAEQGGLPPLKGPYHRRRVRWRGFAPRAVLRDPAALQDPAAVFALRGEDALTVEAAGPP